MNEEIYLCAKCREIQSYMYNDFDEIVSYVHCACKKLNPQTNNVKKPLDLAFDVLEQSLNKEKVK